MIDFFYTSIIIVKSAVYLYLFDPDIDLGWVPFLHNKMQDSYNIKEAGFFISNSLDPYLTDHLYQVLSSNIIFLETLTHLFFALPKARDLLQILFSYCRLTFGASICFQINFILNWILTNFKNILPHQSHHCTINKILD